jgi:hypothetical protein
MMELRIIKNIKLLEWSRPTKISTSPIKVLNKGKLKLASIPKKKVNVNIILKLMKPDNIFNDLVLNLSSRDPTIKKSKEATKL